MTLLIVASQVVWITAVIHQCPAVMEFKCEQIETAMLAKAGG
jgi:hypothetical protein